MTPEELVAAVKQRAKDNFKTGTNCAECGLEAFLHYVSRQQGWPRRWPSPRT